jgi:hypothetical protein
MFIEIKLKIKIRKLKNIFNNLIIKFSYSLINLKKFVKYRKIEELEFKFLLIKIKLRRYINYFLINQ